MTNSRMTNDEGMTKPENAWTGEERFWNANELSVVREELERKPVYDLEECTAQFGEAIIDFAKTIPQNPVTNRIIGQLVGAGTSVGANYAEAILSSRRFEGPANDLRHSSFGIPSSFVIRHSSFSTIRHSSFSPCLAPSLSLK